MQNQLLHEFCDLSSCALQPGCLRKHLPISCTLDLDNHLLLLLPSKGNLSDACLSSQMNSVNAHRHQSLCENVLMRLNG